ncbi:formin-like protein 5 isoform X2 [Hibiscus syriacus]|uniref:formin-like protein 5 isoform X2 n=1 Tax=Hibiscus syriacus TaxID=106335 RepID=UPI001924D059|nr:formin-like protein 5 isoform X2 [Hibiscus syriacus]
MPIVQGKSCAKAIPCVIFLVILICISLAIILEYRGDGDETFINVLADPSNGEINENLVSLLWLDCRQELGDLSQAFEPKLHRLREILSNIIHTVDYSLAKESIQNFVRHPSLKQALSNCMRKNYFIFEASVGDGGFNPWYIRYVNSLYHGHDVPRRILASKNIAEPPDSDSGPSPSPSPSPSSPPDSAPGSSPDSEAPEFSPIQSPTESPASSPSPSLLKPSNQPPAVHDSHHGYLEYKGLKKTTLFIACIVTALVTAFIAFLFFFLCFRKQINPRPICGDQKLDHQPLGNESSQQKKASKNGGIALEISSDGKPSLGAVAGATVAQSSAESSDKSGNTNSTQPSGGASTSVPGVPAENALAGELDPLPPEPPGPPPPPKAPGAGPRPPAPPRPPPPMPSGSKGPKPPNGPQRTPNASSGEGSDTGGNGAHASKAKLKPFFWDKVAAKPDHAMVWNQIKSGSFQFNEELIQTLFGYSGADKKKNNGKKDPSGKKEHAPQFVQLIDPKKAQNLAILLRALNVSTVDVCDALREGKELPIELLRTLLKMAPTSDEERKFKTFSGEMSQLGPAEQFLKQVLDIPFAFKRMEVLLFMCSLNEEVAATKESFETLEVACKDLRGSRLFLKLLEAVLKTGNRMNDGTYHGGALAFKLDALLKLSDVKGADGKTTLLHFVVQEIIRSEGLKAARVERESGSFTSIKSDDLLEDVSPDMDERYRSLGFQAVSRLSTELESVKQAAAVDAENLTGTVVKLGHSLLKARDFLNSEMKDLVEDSDFHKTLKSFMEMAEVDVMSLLEEEKRIMELVKRTGSYFHGDNKKDEGLRLFLVVRDFLIILDKVCKEVKDKPVKSRKERSRASSHASSSSESRMGTPDLRQKLFPALAELRIDDSSSDDEN